MPKCEFLAKSPVSLTVQKVCVLHLTQSLSCEQEIVGVHFHLANQKLFAAFLPPLMTDVSQLWMFTSNDINSA